jgi:hypothetical protein
MTQANAHKRESQIALSQLERNKPTTRIDDRRKFEGERDVTRAAG